MQETAYERIILLRNVCQGNRELASDRLSLSQVKQHEANTARCKQRPEAILDGDFGCQMILSQPRRWRCLLLCGIAATVLHQ